MSRTKCQCRQLLSSLHVHLIRRNKMKTRTRQTQKLFRRLPCFLVWVGCQSLWRTFVFTLLLTSLNLTASGRRNLWPWVMHFLPLLFIFFIIRLLFLLKVSLYCYVLCVFLQGKTRKKKPCTRPIPFNLSQPKSSRVTADEEPLQTVPRSRTATRPPHQNKNTCNDRLKTPNGNSKLSKPPAASDGNVDSTQGAGKSQGKTPQAGGHCGPSRKLKTLANSYDSMSTLSQNNATASAQSCVDDMNLLSLRSPTKTRGAPHNTQMEAKSKPSESLDSKLILLE